MTGNNMKIATLLMLVTIELTFGDTVYSILNRKDPCISLCEKPPIDFPNSIYMKSCCQRGCRFFNLVNLQYGWEQNSLNGTRSACEASCSEAYTNPNDCYVCNTGCNFMAKQRISDLLSLFTVAICMEESIDILPMSPDIPESDILTDPGLRKELLPRWWDSDGFKLPQTHIKTIPTDAKTMDYTMSSDYSGEIRQPASSFKSESFQRQMEQMISSAMSFLERHYWVFFFLVLSLSLLMSYLVFEIKLFLSLDKAATRYGNVNSLSELELFVPDEAMMYKVPPPKYTVKYNKSNLVI